MSFGTVLSHPVDKFDKHLSNIKVDVIFVEIIDLSALEPNLSFIHSQIGKFMTPF